MQPRLTASFDRVPIEVRVAISERSKIVFLKSGQRLWGEGDSIERMSFLLSGWAKLVTLHSDGREVAIQLMGPGTLLCSGAAGRVPDYCCSMVAISDVEVTSVPRDWLLEQMLQHPSLSQVLLDAMARRAVRSCRRARAIGVARVEQRIARLLMWLAGECAVRDDMNAPLIPVHLTRRDIADLCGTTVETAIRTMRRFESAGSIEPRGAGLALTKLEHLQALDRGEG